MWAPLKTLSTNMIPATAKATPASVNELGRRRVVVHSQPTTRIGRGVLEQQRDADGQVRDRVVVAQLRAGDRDDSVGDDGPVMLQYIAEPVRLDDGGEDGHHQCTACQAGGDRGGRAPARLHERLGEGTRGSECDGGADREQQTEPEVVDVAVFVVAMRAPPGCNE